MRTATLHDDVHLRRGHIPRHFDNNGEAVALPSLGVTPVLLVVNKTPPMEAAVVVQSTSFEVQPNGPVHWDQVGGGVGGDVGRVPWCRRGQVDEWD